MAIPLYSLLQRQSLPLEQKIVLTKRRIEDWYRECNGNVYVSVSGKDSTVFDNRIDDVFRSRNVIEKGKVYRYQQLLFITYRDGAPMMTIGGVVIDEKTYEMLSCGFTMDRYPFLRMERDAFSFNIKVPSLTQKEIKFILQKIPVSEDEYLDHQDDYHNIKYEEIRCFEEIHRYFPYYVEIRGHN